MKDEPAKVEFRDPPPRGNAAGSWARILEPLLKKPGIWAMVRTFETPEQAQDAQSNLGGRKVIIPQPEHDWMFAARGCELFAIYHGLRRPRVVKPKGVSRTRTRRQAS